MRNICNKKITNITATRKSAYEKLLRVAKSHNVPRKWKILKYIEKHCKIKTCNPKKLDKIPIRLSVIKLVAKLVLLLEKLSRGASLYLCSIFIVLQDYLIKQCIGKNALTRSKTIPWSHNVAEYGSLYFYTEERCWVSERGIYWVWWDKSD